MANRAEEPWGGSVSTKGKLRSLMETPTGEREQWCMTLAKAMDASGASFEDYRREVLRRYPDTKFVDIADVPPLRTV